MAGTKLKPKAAKAGASRHGNRVGVKVATLKARKGLKSAKTRGIQFYGGGIGQKVPKIKVTGLRAKLGLSQAELARVTGYSLRSVAGWESGKPLSDSARQRMIETERLHEALSQILPPGKVADWMRTPNPAFEGQTPIQVIERGESDRLWRMIVQIDSNVAS